MSTSRTAWPQIDPGEMVHWITFMAEKEIVDISGTETIWVPFLQTWAAIEPVSGRDVIRGGQQTTTLFVAVTIRYQHGILPDQRIQLVTGELLIIQSIENPGYRNLLLKLNCVGLGHR